MKFWIVKCHYRDTEEIEEILIAGDENYTKAKIKKDLMTVYTKYKKMSLRQGKKPVGWSLFEGTH